MATPILATKLYIPPPRPKVVLRPRLIERLNEGLRAGRRLSLLAAPAGFGKTTLLSEWVHQEDEGRRTHAPASRSGVKDESGATIHPSSFIPHAQRSRVAWLSLDESDNDLSRFLMYVVAALQTIDAGLGAEALDLLGASQPPAELILTTLINKVAGTPQEIILVLDDYHLI